MTPEVCVGCKATDKPLRECADGRWLCRRCRSLWLSQIHSTPVKQAPASIGVQARFDA